MSEKQEGLPVNNEGGNSGQQEPNVQAKPDTKPSLNELLKDSSLQAEFDGKVQSAITTALEKQKAQWEADQSEAAKLFG